MKVGGKSSSDRLVMSLRNAKTSLFFYFVMLVVNLFSRNIFLENLGNTLTGLTSAMQYTIGLLNMADVGIITAISCALFKPVYDNDQEEIQRIISLFCYLFRIVGCVILGVGVILLFVLPNVIEQEVDPLTTIISFTTFLTTTSLSYFVNYKQQLFLASQRTYVITTMQNITIVAKICVQIIIVKNIVDAYYFWLLAEVVFAVIYSVFLELKITKEYPWLKSTFTQGRLIRKDYKDLFVNLRQIVSHKFASVVLTQTDTLIISYLLSLVSATFYQNYAMLFSRLLAFLSSAFSGSWAGVGNLISEGNTNKTMHVFNQYNSLVLLLGGAILMCVYFFVSPFITVWLGSEYLLDNSVVIIMTISLYVSFLRLPVSVFLNGYSLYRDTWSAWLEAGLNLVISVVGSIYFGLIGVVLGTAVSTTLVTLLWKPYFLFRNGFDRRVLSYYIDLAKYVLVLAGFFILFGFVADIFVEYMSTSLLHFIFSGGALFLIVLMLYAGVMLMLSAPLRSLLMVFKDRYINKKSRN